MSKILVTGATGFLGKHLLRRLDPARVRALTRAPTKGLRKLGVEVVRGDLLDAGVLRDALEGVQSVYHLAGLVSRNPDDAHVMYRLHVDGTRALCEAALRARVARVVVASTSGTVAVGDDPDHAFTEEDGYATERVKRWPYYLSKIYQEQTALRFAREHGLDVVVVNPSLLLGRGDARQSSTGDVLKFLTRDIPVVPSGGLNFVDVGDAADALVLAMQKGAAGERYLVGGPNWTFEEFFGRLERLSKVPAPRLKVPRRAQTFGARLLEALASAQGRKPTLDLAAVEMAQKFWYLDATKARRVLGFRPRDPTDTLLDTIRYLRRRFLDRPEAISQA
ncbi:MAG TPA: NAD-dependent epimerase/dehydratase family protein [Polyangia bacterium]|nr:NAD-dependent epimerase/dehydratase family protein [Polyangia bacterium]